MADSLKNMTGATDVATSDDVTTLTTKISNVEDTVSSLTDNIMISSVDDILVLLAEQHSATSVYELVAGGWEISTTRKSPGFGNRTISKFIATSLCVYDSSIAQSCENTNVEIIDISRADCSAVTNCWYAFSSPAYSSAVLRKIIFPDTFGTNVTNWGNAFSPSSTIEEIIGILDYSSCTNGVGFDYRNVKLKHVKIANLGLSISFSGSPLDAESVSFLLQNVQDVTEVVAEGSTRTIRFSSVSYALATEEDLASATAKGWTITK